MGWEHLGFAGTYSARGGYLGRFAEHECFLPVKTNRETPGLRIFSDRPAGQAGQNQGLNRKLRVGGSSARKLILTQIYDGVTNLLKQQERLPLDMVDV